LRAGIALSSCEVQVWYGELDLPLSDVRRLMKTLSPDELARANRFGFERDRKHFIVGRGLLPTILAKYVQSVPEGRRSSYWIFGKPALSHSWNSNRLEFSLAHAGAIVCAHSRAQNRNRRRLPRAHCANQVPRRAPLYRGGAGGAPCALLSEEAKSLASRVDPQAGLPESDRRRLGASLARIELAAATPPAMLLQINDQLEAMVSWSPWELALIPGYLGQSWHKAAGYNFVWRDDADPQFFHATKRVRKV
jgi:4'-phosphopantetheinyl transferase